MSESDSRDRRSKARERQRRRRESRKSMTPRTTKRTTDTHLSPMGGVELPKIDKRIIRLVVLVVLGGVFMLAVILSVGLFKNDPPQSLPNALWIGDEWTYQIHDDESVQTFAERLRENEIGTVYARVSELNIDGSWTGRTDMQNQFEEVRQEVTQFAEQFKRFYPDSSLYGTLYIQVNVGEDGYRLDDEGLQDVVADFSTQVIGSLGFDGVMLNVDPVWTGDENFLSLLRLVRQRIGQNALLAVAVPPDWTPVDVDVPTPVVIEPGTVWDEQYKQRVALIQIDQIVMKSYHSYLTDPDEYREWMAYQVQAFGAAIAALQSDTELIVGIPTYEDALPAHDNQVENIATAASGIRRGIAQLGDAAVNVAGVALYAEWDMDDAEWEQFQREWIAE